MQDILTEKINLGLDIGSHDILSEFSDEVKPRNFAFSVGIDLLKNSISSIKLRNDALKILDKSNLAKNNFFPFKIHFWFHLSPLSYFFQQFVFL